MIGPCKDCEPIVRGLEEERRIARFATTIARGAVRELREENKRLRIERDRYREALERIAVSSATNDCQCFPIADRAMNPRLTRQP